jgi:hypothetical protein
MPLPLAPEFGTLFALVRRVIARERKAVMVDEKAGHARSQGADEREPLVPEPEPGNTPEKEPGNEMLTPDADKPPTRREGVISDPDC